MMMEKRRQGQLVSFADVFGRMIGETLLANVDAAKLSDQRTVIRHGEAPMPLYTCLNAKKDKSALLFRSAWFVI